MKLLRLTTITLLIISLPACACLCLQEKSIKKRVATYFKQADAVFIGVPTETIVRQDKTQLDLQGKKLTVYRTKIWVKEIFKGTLTSHVFAETEITGWSCDTDPLETHREYVIYATVRTDQVVAFHPCTGTHSLTGLTDEKLKKEASRELDLLRKLSEKSQIATRKAGH